MSRRREIFESLSVKPIPFDEGMASTSEYKKQLLRKIKKMRA